MAVPPFPHNLTKGPPPTDCAHVLMWQAQMRDRGWRISTDALYGPKSADVCRRFQREKGLTVDGVVGPITWRATWQSRVT